MQTTADRNFFVFDNLSDIAAAMPPPLTQGRLLILYLRCIYQGGPPGTPVPTMSF